MGIVAFVIIYILGGFGAVALYAHLEDEGKLDSVPGFLKIVVAVIVLFAPLLIFISVS